MRGFKTFPLRKNSKLPAVKDWENWAKNADAEQLGEYDGNFGVATGPSNLVVIDVDIKNDVNGMETLRQIRAEGKALPPTFSVETPTGGLHLYYKGNCKSGVGVLGKGLDIRSQGGYVVAPGSKTETGEYRIIKDIEVAQVPLWVLQDREGTKREDLPTEGMFQGERNNTLTSIGGTLRSRGLGHEAILAALTTVNQTQLEEPLDQLEVELIAHSVSRYQPSVALAASAFENTTPLEKGLSKTANTINPEAIAPRDWVMENRLLGGFVSVLIAPGGVGKSTLALLDAASISSGKPLSGSTVLKKGAAWVYNLEDPLCEMERRVAALAQHYQLTQEDLENLHITSGRDTPLNLAASVKDGGVVINEEAVNMVIGHIRQHDIKTLVVDPFLRAHTCNENSNAEIDKVMATFQGISEKTGCAIMLVHHTNKGASKHESHGDMDSARGASSMVYAARIAHTLSVMSEGEAKKVGIPEDRRRWYMRIDNAKANLQAPASRANWFERHSVQIANGEWVGTIQGVELESVGASLKDDKKRAIQNDFDSHVLEVMGGDEEITCLELYRRLETEHSHLFAKATSEKTAKNIVIALCKGSDVVEHVERLGKSRHWVIRKD